MSPSPLDMLPLGYPNRRQYPGAANLFLWAALNRDQLVDGGGEYEGMFLNFAVENSREAPYLGYADDNWVDGTQSFTFNFLSPGIMELGYGFTTTQIHEFGHHFGMSHPHDGYDYEEDLDYGPGGDMYFVWITDEVNSMMSYIDLNWDYSQFDRDNANRYQAAAYITNANAIAADILASANASAASADLQTADTEIGLAKQAMADHDYDGALEHARSAYQAVRAGAADAGVEVKASTNGWSVLPPTRGNGSPKKNDHAYKDRIDAGSHRSRP